MDALSDSRKRKLQELKARALRMPEGDRSIKNNVEDKESIAPDISYSKMSKEVSAHEKKYSATLQEEVVITDQDQIPNTTEEIIAQELSFTIAKSTEGEVSLAPRKINADLKQQVSAKVDKLQRRTQRAIVDILRQRIAFEGIDE